MTAADPASRPDVWAVLLAGGRASRMGGVAKPLLPVAGRTMLAHAAAAAAEQGAAPIIAVGPRPDAEEGIDPAIRWIREEPAFAGPAAAVVAAVTSAPEQVAPWTLLLACDLPRAGSAVRLLAESLPLLPTDTDGVCLADGSGRPQWLTGIYRTAALRGAVRRIPDGGRDAPVRALLDDLAIAVIADPDGSADDVDTWEDLERATQRADAD